MLDELLMLSEKHLQSIKDEDWDESERIADRKEAIYSCLQQDFEKNILPAATAKILKQVEVMESHARSLLAEKMEDTSQTLAELGKLKTMLKGYDETDTRRGHFLLRA